ncbi:MAG TPA: DUF481 domain-containing protein [Vicinamibacteria bacterium]|nr:DUF481 domain-containing protein [Vicinamibacteria bacterium]
MRQRAFLPSLAVAPLLALLAAPPAAAQVQVGWNALVEAGAATTAGNSETISLNARGEAAHQWLRTELRFSGGLIRNSVRETTRFAVGTPGNVVEDSTLVPKAANYFAHADLLRRVTERFFWKVGGDWERDRFAGVDSRAIGRAGVGLMWDNRRDTRFQTAVDATYTSETMTVEDPSREETYPGARFSMDAERRFGGEERRNAFTSKLLVDQNLSDSDDTRVDFTNALALAVSRRLSLKAQVQLKYDRQPGLVEIDLFATAPGPGVSPIGKAAVTADELDAITTLSLVVNLTPGRSGARPTP